MAHAETKSLTLTGRLVDVFDPSLSVRDSVELRPGNSGLYRDVATLMNANEPALLHVTHRLVSCEHGDGTLRFTLRGPAETPGVARVFFPTARPAHVTATGADGHPVDVVSYPTGGTILMKVPIPRSAIPVPICTAGDRRRNQNTAAPQSA